MGSSRSCGDVRSVFNKVPKAEDIALNHAANGRLKPYSRVVRSAPLAQAAVNASASSSHESRGRTLVD
jgi:hypothetical protein